MKVLVTGAGAVLGQGILRSLKNSGIEGLEIIAADPSPLSAGLYWVSQRYLIPLAKSPEFIGQIEELVLKTGVDLLIPGTDAELSVLAEYRERLECATGVKILISSPRVVEIADDKYQTAQFFLDKGFSPPQTVLPEGLASLVEKVGFPLIVKPRRGARSVGVSRVERADELQAALSRAADPVIQECIGDDHCEYTAGTLTFEGICHAAIVMRRDLRDGNTYRAYVDQDPAITAQVRQFAEALGAFGPANFQFRLDRGVARVFEINARFSGTTPLRMHAGLNEVALAVRYLLEGVPVHQPVLRQVTILRHWDDTVIDESTVPPVRLGA